MNVSGTLRVIHHPYCKTKSLLYPRDMKLLFNSPSIQISRYRSGADLTCGFHNVVSQKFPNRPFRSLKRNSQNQMFIDATRTFRENMKLCSKICVQLNALQFLYCFAIQISFQNIIIRQNMIRQKTERQFLKKVILSITKESVSEFKSEKGPILVYKSRV